VVLVRGSSCRRARVGAGFDFLFFPCLLVGLLVFSRGGGGGLGGAGIFFAGEIFFLVLYTPHLRPSQQIPYILLLLPISTFTPPPNKGINDNYRKQYLFSSFCISYKTQVNFWGYFSFLKNGVVETVVALFFSKTYNERY